MSGFGGRGRGSGGRSGGRSSGGRGGSGRYNSHHNHHNHNQQQSRDGSSSNVVGAAKPRFNPCRNFTSTGSCQQQHCNFAHVVQLHSTINASSRMNPQQVSRQAYEDYLFGLHAGGNPETSFLLPDSGSSNSNNTRDVNRFFAVTAVAIWDQAATQGGAAGGGAASAQPASQLKIFSGCQDGHWRLWNPTRNFSKEFEHTMGRNSRIYKMEIFNNHLFVAFEGTCTKVPRATVGMVHAWNLNNPSDPPIEFHMGSGSGGADAGDSSAQPNANAMNGALHNANPNNTEAANNASATEQMAPYAHAMGVSSMLVHTTPIVTGSIDGTVRLWRYVERPQLAEKKFAAIRTLHGHARAVTGLALIPSPQNNILWTASVDHTIRIWDITTGLCRHLISAPVVDADPNNQSNQGGQPSAPGGDALGHTGPITSLILWEDHSAAAGAAASPSTAPGVAPTSPQPSYYVLTSSLDGTVKAWNANTGDLLTSEQHGRGVVSIALGSTAGVAGTTGKGHPLLFCGLEGGLIMVRNLQQTPTTPPLCLLFTLNSRFIGCGHVWGCVRTMSTGPACTFYTGGDDGRCNVWQIMGDLGLG